MLFIIFFFQAEDGIRDLVRSRGLGDVYKRQRLGIAPLYNTFADIHTAVERLRAVVVERLYERYDATGLLVT